MLPILARVVGQFAAQFVPLLRTGVRIGSKLPDGLHGMPLQNIQFRVEVKGVPELMARIDEFSDRRFNAAVATALTRIAVGVRDEMRSSAWQTFDNPRPYTVNSIRSIGATALTLRSMVEVRQDSPAAKYLLPQVYGGARPQKRFEQLTKAFKLPPGWVTVPGPAAQIDSFGNMRRAQLRQVLAQVEDGTRRKRGARYFVMPPGRNAAPGVYQRDAGSRSITAVLLFVETARYGVRWRFHELAHSAAAARAPAEMQRAFREAVARFQARARPRL